MEDSIARQKAAVQKQSGAVAGEFFTAAWMAPPVLPIPQPEAPCPPMREADAGPPIAAAAKAQNLQPELIRAVIRQESGFRPCAVSAKGALGLMQLMPETAEELNVADPFLPAQNIQGGAQYLRQLLDRFGGDLKLALAAYNAGPERAAASSPAIPDIPETRDYVEQVLKELARVPGKN